MGSARAWCLSLQQNSGYIVSDILRWGPCLAWQKADEPRLHAGVTHHSSSVFFTSPVLSSKTRLLEKLVGMRLLSEQEFSTQASLHLSMLKRAFYMVRKICWSWPLSSQGISVELTLAVHLGLLRRCNGTDVSLSRFLFVTRCRWYFFIFLSCNTPRTKLREKAGDCFAISYPHRSIRRATLQDRCCASPKGTRSEVSEKKKKIMVMTFMCIVMNLRPHSTLSYCLSVWESNGLDTETALIWESFWK